jgi:ribose 5-phosphate isomerase B
MLVAVGSDHAGFDLKEEVVALLSELKYDMVDYGTSDPESVDYPDFGEKVADAVSSGKADRGILVCGTGIGMSIVANKFPHIRAALCNDLFSARMSRMHNDANILVLAGRIIGRDLAKEIVRTWLETAFEGGRHQRRLDKISAIEDKFSGRNKQGKLS